MTIPADPTALATALALAIPLVYLGAALAPHRRDPFQPLVAATWLAGVLAVVFAVAVGLTGKLEPGLGATLLPVKVDLLSAALLLLVTGVGWVVTRYSRRYLEGDDGRGRYVRWLPATLAAVAVLVTTRDLLVLATAWTATSIALHQLLTYYDRRPAALLAAHKKFLVSRLADLALWSALALVHMQVGSLDIDVVTAHAAAQPLAEGGLQVAAVLFVIAAALKSAQLPFHGWLIQVMEAPTPVSALLHAGVVNLGGFLMIRLAPLMATAPAAQLLLVVWGMATTVLAALVMSTRVSVKVGLAWSTCAQMGFMLVQCGLGAWPLALLHLLAHSLYKAHTFLNSGGRVDQWRASMLGGRTAPPRLHRLLAGGAVVVTVSILVMLSRQTMWAALPAAVLTLAVGLSFVPMLTAATGAVGPSLIKAVRVALFYVGWHLLAERLIVFPVAHSAARLGWFIVAAGFLTAFVVQSILQARPEGPAARALHPRLFAGLHLDERFTRWTFRLWPPRLPVVKASHTASSARTVEFSS